jgi:hypothetical protein
MTKRGNLYPIALYTPLIERVIERVQALGIQPSEVRRRIPELGRLERAICKELHRSEELLESARAEAEVASTIDRGVRR